jgi:MoaA/NifB/PqqE/SkfB family radical SAM enzyme
MDTFLKHVDSLNLIKKGLSKKPWYLILYITSHCNQRCHMCFQHEMLNTLKRSEEWSVEEINKLSKNLDSLYQLTLTGGEPTLRKDLAEIVKIFYDNCNLNRLTITTNGYYPERIEKLVKEIFKNCPNLFLSINMSIDGIGEDHDKIRGLKKSFENLCKTYKLIKDLKKYYPKLNSQTASVLMLSNKDKMIDLLNWINENMNINEHGLMLSRGDVPTKEGKATENKFFFEMLSYHRELCKKKDTKLGKAVANTYLQDRIKTIKKEKMASQCSAGSKLIVIDERANLIPCEILKVLSKEGKTDEPDLGDFTFGNLRKFDYNPNLLINTERGKKINKFIKDNRCWCSFECAQINNFVLNPQSYFGIIKNFVLNN